MCNADYCNMTQMKQHPVDSEHERFTAYEISQNPFKIKYLLKMSSSDPLKSKRCISFWLFKFSRTFSLVMINKTETRVAADEERRFRINKIKVKSKCVFISCVFHSLQSVRRRWEDEAAVRQQTVGVEQEGFSLRLDGTKHALLHWKILLGE